MWEKLKGSRKFAAAVTSLVVATIGVFTDVVSPEMIESIMTTLWVFIVGQGIADAGNGGSQ